SKGLGAPVGSVLCASRDRITEARRLRKMLGGAMRQSGILAAAGLYALEHHVARLAEDHDNARRLAGALARSEAFAIDPECVQTNIVVADLRAMDAAELCARAKAQGVLLSAFGPRRVRLVTHLDVDRAAVDHAGEILCRIAA
ncbi:MAG: hypothetical protein IT378_14320, partial [Sandaracinaceae bacterium]|nr:hypothetical protein [Sandaracinaceae bacterium]